MKISGTEPNEILLSNITWYRKHELIKKDPVIPMIMFDRYIQKILSYLLKSRKVLGEIVAYFGRVEFQGRGSPHYHIIVKCSDAPILGVDSIEDVIAYIDKHTAHICLRKSKISDYAI